MDNRSETRRDGTRRAANSLACTAICLARAALQRGRRHDARTDSPPSKRETKPPHPRTPHPAHSLQFNVLPALTRRTMGTSHLLGHPKAEDRAGSLSRPTTGGRGDLACAGLRFAARWGETQRGSSSLRDAAPRRAPCAGGVPAERVRHPTPPPGKLSQRPLFGQGQVVSRTLHSVRGSVPAADRDSPFLPTLCHGQKAAQPGRCWRGGFS